MGFLFLLPFSSSSIFSSSGWLGVVSACRGLNLFSVGNLTRVKYIYILLKGPSPYSGCSRVDGPAFRENGDVFDTSLSDLRSGFMPSITEYCKFDALRIPAPCCF